MKSQPRDGKHHILQHVHHDYHTSGEQLGPRAEVGARLARDVHLPAEPQDAADDPAGDEFAGPGHHTGVEGELEIVALAAADGARAVSGIGERGGLVEGEVGIDVLVGAIVQDEDGGEEGEHADGFGERADEGVAGAEFLVGC